MWFFSISAGKKLVHRLKKTKGNWDNWYNKLNRFAKFIKSSQCFRSSRYSHRELWNFIAHNKGKVLFLGFIAERMLISANVRDDTKIIFIMRNGLNDARITVVHNQGYKSLGVVNFN